MLRFEKMAMEDLEEHIYLQREAFLPLLEKYQDGKFSPANITAEEMIKRIENPQGVYLKVMADNLSVGGIYAYESNPSQKEMCLSTIYISPDKQGQQFAQKAIAYLEAVCHSVKSWWLAVPQGESKNRYLYEKFGYKYTGRKIVANERLTILIYKKEVSAD